jgi:hypothetical protein
MRTNTVTIATSRPDVSSDDPDAAELLIKEARRKGRYRRLRIGIICVLVFAVLVVLVILTVGRGSITSPRPSKSNAVPPTGVNRSSTLVPRFDNPIALAVGKSDVWVVNMAGNSITEFDKKTGSLVRLINANADSFHHPDGIVLQGSHLWISNGNEEFGMGTPNYSLAKYGSITELKASDGSLVRVINVPADQLLQPGPIVVSGSHVWVVNSNSTQSSRAALIELNASNGSLVRVYGGNVDGLDGILNMTATKNDVWLTESNGSEGSVTELNSRTGSLVRVITALGNNITAPDPISVNGAHVWIGNIAQGHNALIELNARTGSLVRVIKAKADQFNGVLGVVAQNSYVWVTNGENYESGGQTNSVTELSARKGSLLRVIKEKDHSLYGPTEILGSDSNLWVLNVNSVAELNQRNGSLIQVVK